MSCNKRFLSWEVHHETYTCFSAFVVGGGGHIGNAKILPDLKIKLRGLWGDIGTPKYFSGAIGNPQLGVKKNAGIGWYTVGSLLITQVWGITKKQNKYEIIIGGANGEVVNFTMCCLPPTTTEKHV